MGSISALYIRKVPLARLTEVWPAVAKRPAVTVRRATSGTWLELAGTNNNLEGLGRELSRLLETEAVLFNAMSSVGLVEIHAWESGTSIRHLSYSAMDGGWGVVTGEPLPWEHVFAQPPKVGATDQRLVSSQGEDVRHALGVGGPWGPARRFEGAPESGRWVPIAMIVVPILIVLFTYLLL